MKLFCSEPNDQIRPRRLNDLVAGGWWLVAFEAISTHRAKIAISGPPHRAAKFSLYDASGPKECFWPDASKLMILLGFKSFSEAMFELAGYASVRPRGC